MLLCKETDSDTTLYWNLCLAKLVNVLPACSLLPSCLPAHSFLSLPACLCLQASAIVEGQWVLLQNTHLGLGYLTEVEGFLSKADPDTIHDDFR